MVAIAILCAVYVIIYCSYITRLISGLGKVGEFVPTTSNARTGFSIVIPFRNEQENLGHLLESISSLDYPKDLFELIFIDDASTDDSVTLINRWRMQNGLVRTTLIENIQMTPSPKKNAIMRSIPIAAFDWVITTDADCKLPATWLTTFDAFICQNTFEMIAAPVRFTKGFGLLKNFQRLDFLSLQSVTVGSFGIRKPFMCNGANFAYKKSFFELLGGFAGNEKIASGDDVFLLQKAAKEYPEKLGYLKSEAVIVETLPEKNLGNLFNQRVRWAAKASSYKNDYAEDLALVVFLSNLAMVALFVMTAFGLDWRITVAVFVLKLIPDWVFLHKGNRFLKSHSVVFPVFGAVFYPLFTVAVALYAIFGKYSWKGRKFRV
ncbi:glycosyltransferase family 2 protein [Flavobacterium silvaticum]|uniref:Glycosyltransferase n=1 Tax=Flavobacterium silvaticum TaxID=1852020 RepID=A0A972FLX3_9FLAO|nr:glycosyltransferase [Flavobacterium silvaticum]NMH28479.1 glycosyltransferase [Flavobacterium silvaticum]